MEFVHENCKICGSDEFVLLHKTKQYHFGRCRNCGFFYLNPMPKMTEEEIRQFYQSYSYNRQFIQNFEEYRSLIQYSLEGKINTIKNLLEINNIDQSWKFLDIGCGGGGYVYAAKELGLEAHGVDIDANSCAFAQSMGLNVFNGELKEAGYPNGYFDIIQIKQVLEHISDPREFLSEVRRILSDRGIVVIDVPNQNGLIPNIKILLNWKNNEYGFLQPMRHLYAYTAESLKYLLEQIGLQVIKHFTSGPGDPIYYPLYKQKLPAKWAFRIASSLDMGSIIVAYVTKSHLV